MTRALPALPIGAEKKNIALGGQTLKLIALWFMLFDHIVTLFVPQHTLLRLLFKIPGGISAPLFFFCIARGFEHSRCKGAYCRRLFFFALLSHVPYILCFSYGFFEATSVLFPEALGACALLVQRQEKLSPAVKLLLIFGLCVLAIPANWNYLGILWVLAFGMCRDRKTQIRCFVLLGLLLWVLPGLVTAPAEHLWRFGFLLAVPFLRRYTESEPRPAKRSSRFFYWFYPLHLLLLSLVRLLK